MKLKNVLIAVTDMERSKRFYHDLFGLDVILDGGDKVIMTEGLVLQSAPVWEEAVGGKVIFRNHAAELYFEENNMDSFVEKLEKMERSGGKVEYVNRLTEHPWGQKIVRFYDPDGNLIEVGSGR
ncbi:glyoxalase [Lachnoclostridium sp. An169]|uniref:VOC family protein n=1 Tax=Lachnoclostridium sp. An169 TaxID=1965569 RepID=UPI000B3A068A|nr:VOC family protein [Lachnoclostridium sp. An169]OUP84151.1 glyoxalase [Lachnoclostridium sp. An169]